MRKAEWSWRGPVLPALARRIGMSAGLATLAVTGATTLPVTAATAATGSVSGTAGGPAGSAPQVPAWAQFVNSPRAIPASGGARQACPTPSRPGQMACMALVPDRAKITSRAGPPAGAYNPADLLGAYGLTSAAGTPPSGAGGATTVAIVDAYNDSRASSDLAAYRARYGLPGCPAGGAAPCLRIVNSAGGSMPPRPDRTGDWEFEESVDLDMVSAICPYCRILLVEARSDSIASLAAAEGYAARHASVVSNSWGSGAEFTGENAFDSRFDHPGVAIVAAAGDAGYGTQYPAASQFVTAVGGTTLMGATPASRGTETAWSGTGSGCSSLEPKPAWQQGSTPSGCQNRTETDVSADADPHTPVAVYDTASSAVPGVSAGWNTAAGTSVATPIIAAAYALAGTPAPGTYPASYPYRQRRDFTDVTSGSNGRCEAGRRYLCHAGAGYDGPTGLGTPYGTGGLTGPSDGVTVTNPGTQDITLGRRTRLRIAAVSSTGGSLAFAAAGLPAGLRLSRSGGLISGRPAVAGIFRVTVSATGQSAGSGSVRFAIVVVRGMAADPPAAGLVRLDGRGRCLAAAGRRQAGARVEIERCDGRGAQDWRFRPAPYPGGAGTLKLRGRCLSIGTRKGAGVTLRACTGSAGQRWQYRSRDQLYSPAYGKCLTGPGSGQNGIQVAIWPCGHSAAQSWELSAGPVLSAVTGRCLTDPSGTGAPGTKIMISPCRTSGAQWWTMKRDAALRIRGECLAVAGSSRQDGAVIELARCSGAAAQKWFTGPAGELLNGNSGRCLADPGNAPSGGAGLVQEDCYGRPGELWAVS
jgi:hypothetical protein